jgi:hypothetical protein
MAIKSIQAARSSKNETATESLLGDFKLELPSDLRIAPDYTFNVAKNWIMRVWKQVEHKPAYEYDRKRYEAREEIYYTVEVHSKNGKPMNERHYRSGNAKTLLELMLMAEAIAYELRPKSKTVKVDLDEDGE